MLEGEAGAYPVRVGAAKPVRYQRVHVLLRFIIWLVVSWIGNTLMVLGLLLGPVISAVLIGQRGGEAFHERYGATYAKAVAFLVGLEGYLFYVTDHDHT